jgi:hypothetical protein
MSKKKVSKSSRTKRARSGTNDVFEDLVSKHFSYLRSDYGLEKIAVEKSSYECYVTFSNKKIAVQVSLEMKDGGIFVMLIRLVDGKLPTYEVFIRPDTAINHFDLEDVVDLKNPEFSLEQEYSDESYPTIQELEENLSKYAEALRKYGKDILAGDFRLFPQLELVIRRRAGHLE